MFNVTMINFDLNETANPNNPPAVSVDEWGTKTIARQFANDLAASITGGQLSDKYFTIRNQGAIQIYFMNKLATIITYP